MQEATRTSVVASIVASRARNLQATTVDTSQIPLPVPIENKTDIENFEDTIDTDEILNMPSKDMPSPYARDAPKFQSKKPKELNHYIQRLEELFAKYSIDDDKEKIKYLGAYADAHTEKEWETMSSYETGIFEDHKKEIIDSYPEASNKARGSIKRTEKNLRQFLRNNLSRFNEITSI